jgi:hypothetical protein
VEPSTRLGRGEVLAGASGALLILFMFLDWFGNRFEAGVVAVPNEQVVDAWHAYDFTDVVLFVTAAAAIGLALVSVSGSGRWLRLAGAVVAGLGVLSVVLVVVSIIGPPEIGGVGGSSTRVGVWLGLAAAVGVAAGGSMAIRDGSAAPGAPPPQA